jgi:starch synthase
MSDPALKLLMVASEAAPFAKTGGLADVVGSLPPALHALGHDVRLVMPWYRNVRSVTGSLRLSRRKISVPMGGRVYQAGYRTGEIKGVPVYFIDVPEFYDRPELYGEQGQDYPDNAERFGLLSRAALELVRQIGFAPDVIHAHDWQAGLVPVYLHQQLWRDPFFAGTGSLFSIHNLGYQGIFPLAARRVLGLDEPLLANERLEYYGQISLLKGGISFADQVNTVSPTYCREIQTPEQGMGLDGLLRSRTDRLHGLLNGLDGNLWSPADDQALPHTYTAKDLSGKMACKKALQQELGLQLSAETPIIAMVTRLDSQKGIELVLECWDKIMQRDLQLVILGTGNPGFERRLADAAEYYPGQVRVLLRFDDALSRRIYAGSDLFLMPSRYEPCGLGQLIALRYGSIPLVHATGGLADTIVDPQASANQTDGANQANGFAFHEYRHSSLLECLDRALATYAKAKDWRKLMLQGMTQDMTWAHAAGQYVDLYRSCIDVGSGIKDWP